MTCDRCFKSLSAGVHGEGLCPFEPRSASAVVGDDIPGGQWFENGFDTPQKFYSHSEHRAALAARGLEIRAKHAGDKDKHLSNWAAAIDPYTLENAKILLSRGKPRVGTNEPDPRKEFPITVTEMTETFKYRMEP
jgi:hypothetical protein